MSAPRVRTRVRAVACAVALAVAATSVTHAGGADEREGIARCAAVENAAARLRCYDDLAKSLEPGRREGSGAWSVEKQGDPPSVRLASAGDREARGRDGAFRPRLVIDCGGGQLSAYVETGMPAQDEYGEDLKTVILRFDDDRPFTDRLEQSDDGTRLEFSSSEMLVNQLLLHDALDFQFTPRHHAPASTTFDLRGLPDLFAPLGEVCGYVLNADGVLVPPP